MICVAAVDLGASSGRVMRGRVGSGRLELTEVHRFPNAPVRVAGTLYWDILGLYREILAGLSAAAGSAPGPSAPGPSAPAAPDVHSSETRRSVENLDGIGIDSWAVDYGLLDRTGALLGNPVHYRDGRTTGILEQVVHTVPEEELYAVTGLQQLPFNTIYQLVSAGPRLESAQTMLLIPDLLGYWLTGEIGAEATNASTTQLYDVRARRWSTALVERVGIPSRLLPPLREPGEVIGGLLPAVAAQTGLDPATPVIAVGSHDTASAVVAVPAVERFAFISSGTWSLVGLELDSPVLTAEARLANFTNEGGVDGRTRFLRNVMGLWLLQESMRTWNTTDLAALLAQAAACPPFAALIDPDDPAFLAPGDIPLRIAEHCRSTGQHPPAGPPETVRCILESLALAYRRTVREAQRITGQAVDVVHVIGGGARNELLCRLTADACGLPVLAGPTEAAALGNVLVQARTLGADLPDLEAMRSLVRANTRLAHYRPNGDETAWAAAERRVFTA